MIFRKSKPELPSFQFTSMIDMVFLLLCFFVTTSVFSQWEMEVDLTLPSAKSGKMPDRLPGEVIINLAKDGTISVNSLNLTLEDLSMRLKRLAKAFPGQSVVLRSDKDVLYSQVMEIIDLCRESDIWNINFATNGEEAK